MKTSLKDVAIQAGVSETTASLVLNDKQVRVSDKTRIRIKETARELGYVANMNAKNLASNQTGIIGVVLPNVENPYFAALNKIIESELRSNNLFPIVCSSEDRIEVEIDQIKKLTNIGVDGLIICMSEESFKNSELITITLDNLSIPFVLVDRYIESKNYNQVIYDNQFGGKLIGEYIVKKEKKRIGILKSKKEVSNIYDRYLGVVDFLLYNSPEQVTIIDCETELDIQSGYLNSKELIDKNVECIVCANDLIMLGAMKRIDEEKKNIEVIGYDKIQLLDQLLSSFTTIKQDNYEMGREAVTLLINNLKNKTENKTITLKPTIYKK